VESQIRWCLFTDIMAITGLLLGAIRSEREKALAALRDSNKALEWQVQQRTLELTQANADLQAALAERRRLQLEMNQITEERQKLVGQELHDGLGQQLTGIAFMINSLRETLAARSAPEAPVLQQVGGLLGEAMAMLRSLSRGLYPIALDTGGLAFALQQLAQHTRNFSKIQCTVRYSEDVQITDAATSLNLYRITQEAVSNALRHAQAGQIDIELSGSGNHYVLSITDDGAGFRDRSSKIKETLGLRSMQSRAEMIGATIEIRKHPDDGTSIVVTGSLNREGQDLASRT
jgi:signal transduction histidine kinase